MTMTRPPLEELIARADELADKFENYEPKPEDFDAPLPPLMAVKLAAFKRARAESELAAAIDAAREADVSWRALGEAIGTSGEAARQRYAGRTRMPTREEIRAAQKHAKAVEAAMRKRMDAARSKAKP